MKGRNIIVTGAGNGLGLAIATRFVALGGRVALVDKNEVVLKRIGSKDLPSNVAFGFVKDLADDDVGTVVFEAASSALGPINILVNNAVWSFHKPMLEVTASEFDRLIRVNQRAPYFLAQDFARRILSADTKPVDPVIVNIASVNALSGNANLVAYAGTKGAIVAMTRAMAVELAPMGIRVNSISPGAVETPATQSLIQAGVIDSQGLVEDLLIPRLASTEEIAELVIYLCRSCATYVNGVNWVIDGGYLAR